MLNNKVTVSSIIIIIVLTFANICYELLLGNLHTKELSSMWGVLLFLAIIICAFVPGNYVISRFVNPTTLSISEKSRATRIFRRTINVIFYLTLTILIIISFQIVSNSQYSVNWFISIAAISFGSASIAMARLAIKLFSWYQYNRNSIIILYGFTFSLVATGIGTIIVINGGLILIDKGGTNVDPTIKYSNSTLSPGTQTRDYSKQLHLFNILSLPLRVAYVLTWFVTVVILRNYSSKVGKKKFWTLVTIPLILYIVTALLFTISSATTGSALLGIGFLTIVRIAYALTTTISGIFFAVIFFTVSAALKDAEQTEVQKYLNCSAYGTMIMVVTFTIPLSSVLYPPFVLISWAFMGVGSYLLSIGFYTVFISVSQDLKLRKSIKKLVISESKFFENMATAQMQSELQGRVARIVRKQEQEMENHTTIKSSLTDEDMKSYLNEVIKELNSH